MKKYREIKCMIEKHVKSFENYTQIYIMTKFIELTEFFFMFCRFLYQNNFILFVSLRIELVTTFHIIFWREVLKINQNRKRNIFYQNDILPIFVRFLYREHFTHKIREAYFSW